VTKKNRETQNDGKVGWQIKNPFGTGGLEKKQAGKGKNVGDVGTKHHAGKGPGNIKNGEYCKVKLRKTRGYPRLSLKKREQLGKKGGWGKNGPRRKIENQRSQRKNSLFKEQKKQSRKKVQPVAAERKMRNRKSRKGAPTTGRARIMDPAKSLKNRAHGPNPKKKSSARLIGRKGKVPIRRNHGGVGRIQVRHLHWQSKRIRETSGDEELRGGTPTRWFIKNWRGKREWASRAS